MRKTLLFVFALLYQISFICSADDYASSAQRFNLLSRENYSRRFFPLDDLSWNWLKEKRVLRVGVWETAEPLAILTRDGTYQGISADYTKLVAQYLGLNTQIILFSNKESALGALAHDQIDLIVDPEEYKPYAYGNLVQKSINFIHDHPVLVYKQGKSSESLKYKPGMKLAVARWYSGDSWLKIVFPGAQITSYATDEQALSSVAFGENDFYVGSLINAAYQIDRNYNNILVMQEVYFGHDIGLGFLLNRKHPILLRVINQALAAIPDSQNQIIMHHWSNGSEMLDIRHRITLSAQEENWIKAHPTVSIAIASLFAPVTMIDPQGNFYGIAADVIRLIRLRTGINFIPVAVDSVQSSLTMVSEHKADFAGGMEFFQHDDKVSFTRPYISTPYIIITRSGIDEPLSLRGHAQLAILGCNPLISELKRYYPNIRFQKVDNITLALQLVADGKVDGAVHTLIGASYMIDRFYRGQLRINRRVGEAPAEIAFAVRNDQPELLSILNKSLSDIPASEIANIIIRWQSRPDVPLSSWGVYRTQFLLVTGIATSVVIISLIWIYLLLRQITARHRAQLRLQSQLQFSDTLLNTVPLPIYVVDIKGKLLLCNQAWHDFFINVSPRVLQTSLVEPQHLLHPLWNESCSCFAPRNNKKSSSAQPMSLSDGVKNHQVVHYAVPYIDNNQNIAGLICTWVDVTEQEELTRELLEARERAEQANRAKSTFLATMSHEIRTPVSAIIGLLELAVNTPGKAQDEMEPVRVAWESACSLMGLIGDILDMARIESGRLELTPEWVHTNVLVPPVLRVFEGLARQKSLALRCQMPPLLPWQVFIDPLRFRQILSNLVSNAIKFTDQGSVCVDLAIQKRDHQHVWLTVTVKDSGRGIADDEQRELFAPWSQTQDGRKQRGAGLGLAICSQLVGMMDGTITMTSKLNSGTQVQFTIPVAARVRNETSEPVVPRIKSGTSPSMRVLIVDDHPANRLLLQRQFVHLGHIVTEAKDGEQGWALWQTNPFDLVVTDISMPNMDGLELTKLIRTYQTTPVFIMGLTANAWPEERSRCLEAGMDECLFKPLQLPQLRVLLDKAALHLQMNTLPSPNTDDESQAKLENVLNIAGLLTLTQNDKTLIRELLSTTLDSNLNDIKNADQYLQEGNWLELARCAHRLAGAMQIINASQIEHLCRQMETSCRGSVPDKQKIIKMWQKISQELTLLNDAIVCWLTVHHEDASSANA